MHRVGPHDPSPRSRTRKGEATRERILDAASALMYEQGVARTSVEEVKHAAAVSSSQLYHYFDDKQALVTAVVARQGRLVLDVQRPRLLEVDDLAALRAWRDSIVRLVEDRAGVGGCPIGSLASELSDRDPEHRAALAASFDQWQAAIRGGLARMRGRGALAPSADPDELSLALLAALEGGLLLAQVQRSSRPVATALDQMIERIAGFSTEPARSEADRSIG